MAGLSPVRIDRHVGVPGHAHSGDSARCAGASEWCDCNSRIALAHIARQTARSWLRARNGASRASCASRIPQVSGQGVAACRGAITTARCDAGGDCLLLLSGAKVYELLHCSREEGGSWFLDDAVVSGAGRSAGFSRRVAEIHVRPRRRAPARGQRRRPALLPAAAPARAHDHVQGGHAGVHVQLGCSRLRRGRRARPGRRCRRAGRHQLLCLAPAAAARSPPSLLPRKRFGARGRQRFATSRLATVDPRPTPAPPRPGARPARPRPAHAQVRRGAQLGVAGGQSARRPAARV